MADVKFTPGPWGVEPRTTTIRVSAPSGKKIADLSLSSWQPAPTAQANAHLIAAAPDLYEALAHTLSLARLKWGNLDPDANGVFEAASAALAKARGQ